MKKNNRKGFTITELVIVIAVIAILAAVLIPTFAGIIEKANDSAVLQEARNVYTEYTAEFDYSAGNSPEQNLVIKVGEKYVAVKGAQMQDEIYDDLASAKTAANNATYVICDEHVFDKTAATGKCTDCGADCPETHTTGTCAKCGKVTA